MRSQRVRHNRATNTHRHLVKVLQGNSQTRSQWLLLGKTRVGCVQGMKWRGGGGGSMETSLLLTRKTYPCISWVFQFSRSVVSDSLWPHESQHARPPCPSPTLGVHSDSRPSSPWCHPAISSSVVSFSSCPESLPASASFPKSQLFTWCGQNTGVSASASFPPKKSQGWSPSEWTWVFRLMHLFIRNKKRKGGRKRKRWCLQETTELLSAKALPSPPLHSAPANAETAHPRISPLFPGMSVLGF